MIPSSTTSGVVGQTRGDSGLRVVEREGQRRAAGIAGGVGLAGDDGVRAIDEAGLREVPGARCVGSGGRGDGAAVDREVNDGVGGAVPVPVRVGFDVIPSVDDDPVSLARRAMMVAAGEPGVAAGEPVSQPLVSG